MKLAGILLRTKSVTVASGASSSLELPSASEVVKTLVFRARKHINGILTGKATENLEPWLGEEETSIPLELRARAISPTRLVVAPTRRSVGE